MTALVPVLIQLLQAGITIVPEWIATYNKVTSLAKSGTAPTSEVQVEIDTALDEAHAALQAAQPATG